MKELLKEIDHYSRFTKDKEDNSIHCISLKDLKEILKRYEVISKELNQPYTT